jgi:hypothetical protein
MVEQHSDDLPDYDTGPFAEDEDSEVAKWVEDFLSQPETTKVRESAMWVYAKMLFDIDLGVRRGELISPKMVLNSFTNAQNLIREGVLANDKAIPPNPGTTSNNTEVPTLHDVLEVGRMAMERVNAQKELAADTHVYPRGYDRERNGLIYDLNLVLRHVIASSEASQKK